MWYLEHILISIFHIFYFNEIMNFTIIISNPSYEKSLLFCVEIYLLIYHTSKEATAPLIFFIPKTAKTKEYGVTFFLLYFSQHGLFLMKFVHQ